jgi:cyclic pyranopterin phosphate synthase
VGPDGEAKMVDVSAKAETQRRAVATGTIRMSQEALDAIEGNTLAKGDALAVARVAGVMAAKRTAELVPLCHQLPLTDVKVSLVADSSIPGIRCEAEVRTVGRTGVEMEAIVAVSIALVTIYDMAKSADRQMTISDIALMLKSGGKSGEWRRG